MKRRSRADSAYQLAWNNVGVIRASEASSDGAVAAFRQALGGSRPLFTARLNLALLLLQRRPAQGRAGGISAGPDRAASQFHRMERIGLVLMELKRFEDARNAFGRAVDADADFAAAHYNLSFVLSQLGDFDGALRETRRALELEPLYVPQKFALTIDLQYEDPTIAIAPELVADVSGEELAGEFSFDRSCARSAVRGAGPEPGAGRRRGAADETLTVARELITQGLLDQAGRSSIGLRRAMLPARPPRCSWATSSPSAVSMARRWSGIARPGPWFPPTGTLPSAKFARCSRCGRAQDAAPLADDLAARVPRDVDVLAARARVRLAVGDAVGALESVRAAQSLAPGRPDLLPPPGPGLGASGRSERPRSAAFNAALQLDPSLVRVWCELGAMEEERRNWTAARAAYERALDLLPTYGPAALALADLIRRTESPHAAIPVLVESAGGRSLRAGGV